MNDTAILNGTSNLEVIQQPRIVAVCDTQPVTAEGIRTLLTGASDLRFARSCDSLRLAMDWAKGTDSAVAVPDVLVLDKAFGLQAILDWLMEWKGSSGFREGVGIVIWGVSVTEAEALRFLQAGARGILRKTAGVG